MSITARGSILLNAASALGLGVLLVFATGSGKGGSSSDASATTTTSDPSEPKVTVSGQTPPNFEYIRGTCDNQKKGQCDEFYGLIPKFSPDSCKEEGGVFTTTTPSPHACPKANLIGTCHYVQSKSGEPGQYANYYTGHGTAAALKADCTTPAGSSKTEWIDAPAQPAASAVASGTTKTTAASAAKAGPKPAASAAPSAKPKAK